MIRLLRHDPSVPREEDGAVEFTILAPYVCLKLRVFSALVNSNMAELLAKRRRFTRKERFQFCLDLYSAETILCLRAIEGHSGGEQIIPALQDNALLPSDFAEYIYHVGSFYDMHSLIRSGLIPGGEDDKKGRQTVFFTTVNPMSLHVHKQRDYDVTKPRIAVYIKWKIHQNTVYWTNLDGCLEEGIDVLTNKTKRDRPSHNTLPAVCIEKVVVMISGEELYNKVFESLRSPQRIALKPALHGGRQGYYTKTHSRKCRETCSGEIEYRIQGLLHSTVQQEDHTRKETCQSGDPHREALNVEIQHPFVTPQLLVSRVLSASSTLSCGMTVTIIPT